MIDAFTNIDQYQEIVPLVSELFIMVREEILNNKREITINVAKVMNLIDKQTSA